MEHTMALVFRRLKKPTVYIRTIMTSSSQFQKVMEDLQTNPYYAKYAQKIAELQKNCPEDFVQRIEKKTAESQRKEQPCTKRYESLSKPKGALPTETAPSNKRLSDIFKVELVQHEKAEEIKKIWCQYHVEKDVIAASIPVEVYGKIAERMKQYPTFLFPLPRSQGYEFFVSQAVGDEVHITTLLCYQVHKENSPECLTLVHYRELENKGIVLMRGEYDKNILDGMEAQCLANQFQLYYGQEHPTKLDLLEAFTKQPDTFKHMDLIRELENIELKLAK